MADKKIGSRYFRAGHALATEAIRLQVRLMKMVGPAVDKLPAIFVGFAENASDEDVAAAFNAAVSALTTIFASADPDDVVQLVEEIMNLGRISYTGKDDWSDIEVDQEFSGENAKDLIPAVVFILRETLGDFFSGVLANGKARPKGRG